MSWWVYLERNGKVVDVDRHAEGGTVQLGGCTTAELNVTYNYGAHFRAAWPDPIEGSGALAAMLHGRLAGDTIASLQTAVAELGTERANDYWDPTPGNAGHALSVLLAWAQQHPHARWRVS